MTDLSHINKQIQKDTADIDFARRQADNQRMMADQRRHEGNDPGAVYYEQEAERFDQQATDMENEMQDLAAEKERVEKRIAELEGQREDAVRNHTDQLSRIDNELAQLRGSSLML